MHGPLDVNQTAKEQNKREAEARAATGAAREKQADGNHTQALACNEQIAKNRMSETPT